MKIVNVIKKSKYSLIILGMILTGIRCTNLDPDSQGFLQTSQLTIEPTFEEKKLSRLEYECLKIAEEMPMNAIVEGGIIIDKVGDNEVDIIWRLDEDQVIPLGEFGWQSVVVSPDISKFAYIDANSEKLIISNIEGPLQDENIEIGFKFGLAQWLDNNHLVLSKHRFLGEGPFTLDTIVILDMITGEQREIIPNFPQINEFVGQIQWKGFLLSRIVVNPNLTIVVYPAKNEFGNPLILWSLVTNSEIGKVYNKYVDTGVNLGTPWWSPDGNQFITSAPPKFMGLDGQEFINFENFLPYVGGFELVAVTKNGHIERLTYLTTEYNAIESDFVWSNDGDKVAFWLEFQNNELNGKQLAVLEVETGRVTNYCISGYYQPIWSPDGNQLAITVPSLTSPDFSDVVLVDIDKGFAVRIIDNAEVAGWVDDGP